MTRHGHKNSGKRFLQTLYKQKLLTNKQQHERNIEQSISTRCKKTREYLSGHYPGDHQHSVG